jgi:hypothetical protein
LGGRFEAVIGGQPRYIVRMAFYTPPEARFVAIIKRTPELLAAIAKDGTITARYTITDPKGAPLDKDGIVTPGTAPASLIAAYIPAGQKQYVSYTTTTLKASQPGNTNAAQVQAANDSGGTWTKNADDLIAKIKPSRN